MAEFAFSAYLYYGDEKTWTVNAVTAPNVFAAFTAANGMAHKLNATAYAVYDPRQDSNGHFFGPCLKIMRGKQVQVFRPDDITGAGRHAIYGAGLKY